MTNSDPVEDFFSGTEAIVNATVPIVTHVSWKRGDEYFVVKARLRLALQAADFERRRFEWNNIVAETFYLSETEKTPRDFVEAILAGRLISPNGEYPFPAQYGGTYAKQYLPLHPEGVEAQTRTMVLQIRGDNQNFPMNYAPLDWELKAANPPYDSLSELCLEYGMGALTESVSLFEAIATDVVAMDFNCRVVGEAIDLAVFAAVGLKEHDVSIGYRVYDRGKVIRREAVSGNQLTWSDAGKARRGSILIDVPPAAVLHCYASYRGVTYQHRWFNDPTIAQNPRRATYERFDPDLETLRAMCVPKDLKFARDLEAAVGSLLWMLGFSVIQLGSTKRLQDGPDLIATTPTEHYLVVECTTGQVKGESKLERLVARAAAVRERLEQSNNRHLKVLPIMVTSMTRAEVAAGVLAAREHGVVVLSREDLFAALDRTLVLPQPDVLYAEGERSLATPPSE